MHIYVCACMLRSANICEFYKLYSEFPSNIYYDDDDGDVDGDDDDHHHHMQRIEKSARETE